MVKLLVFSDSHGSFYEMKRVVSAHPDCERVLFLGDGLSDAEGLMLGGDIPSLLGVMGNCDSFTSPYGLLRRAEETLTVEGYRLLLLHGHTAGAKSGRGGLVAEGRRHGADIVLFGHTHVPEEIYIGEEEGGPMWLFNPGSIARPQDGNKTYGVITLSEKGVLLSHGKVKE